MAKPLSYTPTTRDPLQEELQRSGPALQEGLELLRELHERGALELALKLLRGGAGLSAATLELLAGESGERVLQGGFALARALAGTDPRTLERVLGGLGEGLASAAASAQAGERAGVLELAGALRDPDVQRGLGVAIALLGGLGRGLREP